MNALAVMSGSLHKNDFSLMHMSDQAAECPTPCDKTTSLIFNISNSWSLTGWKQRQWRSFGETIISMQSSTFNSKFKYEQTNPATRRYELICTICHFTVVMSSYWWSLYVWKFWIFSLYKYKPISYLFSILLWAKMYNLSQWCDKSVFFSLP